MKIFAYHQYICLGYA